MAGKKHRRMTGQRDREAKLSKTKITHSMISVCFFAYVFVFFLTRRHPEYKQGNYVFLSSCPLHFTSQSRTQANAQFSKNFKYSLKEVAQLLLLWVQTDLGSNVRLHFSTFIFLDKLPILYEFLFYKCVKQIIISVLIGIKCLVSDM